MLIEFTVGNYRSFKDPVTFSMVAAKLRARDKALDEHNVFPLTDKISLLKSCAVYGANASGKSNLVHAFRFMRHFVLNSSKDSQADEPISIDPFLLSTETENEPSVFEMVFYVEGKRYRYCFTVDKQKVHSEWLYHARVKETNLFNRRDGSFELSSAFKEGKGLPEKTRDNALFLSVVAQFNGEIALTVLRWFRELKIMSGIEDADRREFTIAGLEDESLGKDIVSFVKRMDLGISDIEVQRASIDRSSIEKLGLSVLMPVLLGKRMTVGELRELGRRYSSPTVKTLHQVYDDGKTIINQELLDLDTHESEGTKKLFALAGPILKILKEGKTLIIDELDARLHPLLTEAIIRLFNSNETNPNNAQLVFTTHDTNLLTNKLFRRDQIWFTEKDKYGATDLYSLAEFKVRNDASYERDYIAGKYGAIPFIGGLLRLVEGADG
ncbi:MAG: ATP-binding protein [Bacteroidetes bacterium]|nr:ATP-binding protein [Bacteroidota bacterium]